MPIFSKESFFLNCFFFNEEHCSEADMKTAINLILSINYCSKTVVDDKLLQNRLCQWKTALKFVSLTNYFYLIENSFKNDFIKYQRNKGQFRCTVLFRHLLKSLTFILSL